MQEGDEAAQWPRTQPALPENDDPVVAFLFGQDQSENQPERAPAPRPGAHASRSISRLHNNRGTLYLPTLQPWREP